MEIVAQILVVLGVLAYLGVGVFLALVSAHYSAEPPPWWLVALIVLLWPFAPLLFIYGLAMWIKGGSH